MTGHTKRMAHKSLHHTCTTTSYACCQLLDLVLASICLFLPIRLVAAEVRCFGGAVLAGPTVAAFDAMMCFLCCF